MTARNKTRMAAWLTIAVALGLVALAVWAIIPQILLISRTKPVEATIVSRGPDFAKVYAIELLREHDNEGYVIYGLQVLFNYTIDGMAHVASANTPFRSRDVAEILQMRKALSDSKPREIRYEPGNPEKIYLESGIPGRIWKQVLTALAGAFVLLILAVLLFRLSRIPRHCAACQAELELYYKFCPACSATVSKS